MNLANKLTVLRIILVPFFIFFFLADFEPFIYFNAIIAEIIFLIACFTDFLDGYFARKLNQITDLGKLLDSSADKILVSSALILQVYMAVILYLYNFIESYCMIILIVCTIIILARELFISSFRALAASKGIVIAADMAGKVKTFVQMIALALLIVVLDVINVSTTIGLTFFYIGLVLLVIGAILAIISCINYLICNFEVFSENTKKTVSSNDAIIKENQTDDDLMKQMMQIFINEQKASTSLIIKKLSLSYTLTSKLIDQLENNGWISKTDSQLNRTVLMTKEKYEEVFNCSFSDNT